MPLIHGKSDKAFSQNVRTEMEHGKPQKQALAIAYALKRRANRMAEGGQVKGVHEPLNAERYGAGKSAAGLASPGISKEMHRDKLEEMKSMRGQNRQNLAEGGVVDRIMAARGCYSEGGEVANETEPEADFDPAEFDDLVLRDDLEGHYPGSQEHGDAREDEDREDMIARIMRSRAKGPGHNPRPA